MEKIGKLAVDVYKETSSDSKGLWLSKIKSRAQD